MECVPSILTEGGYQGYGVGAVFFLDVRNRLADVIVNTANLETLDGCEVG